MHHPGISSWRWNRTIFFAAVCAIGFFSVPLYCSAQAAPPGVDTGYGTCSIRGHGLFRGPFCPKCATSGGTKGGSQGASAQDQMAIAVAGQIGTMIGQMLRGDPQQAARQKAEAEARALEQQRIDTENERKKQAAFARLGSELKLDTFDGDRSGLLLKGVEVDSVAGHAPILADSGNELGLKLGDDDLKPLGTQAAVNTDAPDAVTPNTDPMVVDARNVLSGLPKSVDESIPHTPSGNRIRKGFLAIADHDWNAALLWFQDAYNREPGDPGLQRLVDLAQYTLDSQTKLQQPSADSSVTSGLAPQDPAGPATEVKQVTFNETPYTRSNFIARVAAGNMAAEARVQEVYAELRKKYGPEIPFRVRYSLDTNTKIQKAREGEGLSKEELNAQLEAALTEFLKTHKTSPSSVGGAVTAEEIILGGKG